MTRAQLATAHPATIDATSSGTLAVRQIKLAGRPAYVTGSYLIVGSDNVQVPIHYHSVDLVGEAQFAFGNPGGDRSIIRGRKITVPGGNTAATLSRSEAPEGERFFTTFEAAGILSWCGSGPTAAPISIYDRRLQPFYDYLEHIETREQIQGQGHQPNRTAVMQAKALLDALSGDLLVPTRLVAAERRIVIYFSVGAKYSNLEVLNSGVVMMLNSDGRNRTVKRFTSAKLLSALTDVRAHLA